MKHIIWNYIVTFYESSVFVYCAVLFSLYILLMILSRIAIKRNLFLRRNTDLNMLQTWPYAPGISVIAPAFNESVTIISNVRSLLTLNYPRFEVVIVNDGSTDDTLEKLVSEFQLVEVDFIFNPVLPSKPVNRIYKSTNKAYKRLIVVDKENGKSKADAVNAGINVSAFPYFLNTDVDCILDNDTLLMLIQPFLTEKKRVIATGAPLRMANSCGVDAGMLTDVQPPKSLLPRFQEVEYVRSYIMGKMGWSHIDAVPNVSGGLGLFDKEVAIKAGGYDPKSFGEDMDIVVRMCKYMCEVKEDYAIKYIPQTLCWTEGPSTLKVFIRQRVRWARGLWQIFAAHFKVLFNPKYRRLGLIVFPYNFFFELLAPIVEFTGILYYIYIIIMGYVNWPFAIILLVFVYTFSILVTTVALLWDQITFRQYKSWGDVLSLCGMAFIEPFIYHPLIVYASIKGYLNQIVGKKHIWGNMQRKGFKQQAVQVK